MATAYTSLLGLALPVTGELSGTWGDTVNNSITSLLDSAIAGTQTITADTTLTTTTGAANQSRQAILLCSPASANITITAPAQSKIYTVINTSAVYTVTVRGVGPTTGVTLGVSEKAVVAWNGSDFIKISNTAGAGTFTTLSATGVTTVQAGTALLPAITTSGDTNTGIWFPAADTIAFTEGGVESMRINSSGNVGIGSTPSATGGRLQVVAAINNASAQIAGNANGMSVLNQSGLTIYTNLSGGSTDTTLVAGNTASTYMAFGIHNGTSYAERMRIDSSGNVGIGTSSIGPNYKLSVNGTGNFYNGVSGLGRVFFGDPSDSAGYIGLYRSSLGPANSTTAGNGLNFASIDGYTFNTGAAVAFGSQTERMRIDSSGNVGIDTSSPTQPLDVNGNVAITGSARRIIGDFSNATIANRVMFQTSTANGNTLVAAIPNGTSTTSGYWVFNNSDLTNAGRFRMTAASTEMVLTADFNGTGTYLPMTFSTGGSERVRIDTSGKLLVGDTATSSFFDGLANFAGRIHTKASTTNYFWQTGAGTQTYLTFLSAGTPTQTGSISTNGTITAYNTTSDYRLKNITGEVTGAKDFIMALKPKQGTWKSDGSKFVGFLAHEFQEVSPSSVTGEKDALDADGKPIMQSMQASSSEVIANLVSFVQEQQALITALTARITALESN